MTRFRLTMSSDLAEMYLVSLFVYGVCDHLQVELAEAHLIELCAVEAVTNSIQHAYQGMLGRRIWIDVTSTDERLEIDVRDRGIRMPAADVRKLKTSSGVFEFDPTNIELLPESGMGLELIRQLMDEAAYCTQGRTNRLHLTKFLRSVNVKTTSD